MPDSPCTVPVGPLSRRDVRPAAGAEHAGASGAACAAAAGLGLGGLGVWGVSWAFGFGNAACVLGFGLSSLYFVVFFCSCFGFEVPGSLTGVG